MPAGRPPWVPTDDERRRVRLYAGLGMTQEQIGHLIGKSVDALAKRCREELDIGKAETLAKVAGTLVQKALAGDTTSAIFYLKTQGGWKETSVHEHTGSMRQVHDLDKLSDEKLDTLIAILTDAATGVGSEGETVAPRVH